VTGPTTGDELKVLIVCGIADGRFAHERAKSYCERARTNYRDIKSRGPWLVRSTFTIGWGHMREVYRTAQILFGEQFCAIAQCRCFSTSPGRGCPASGTARPRAWGRRIVKTENEYLLELRDAKQQLWSPPFGRRRWPRRPGRRIGSRASSSSRSHTNWEHRSRPRERLARRSRQPMLRFIGTLVGDPLLAHQSEVGFTLVPPPFGCQGCPGGETHPNRIAMTIASGC